MPQILFKNRIEAALSKYQDRKILLTDTFANFFGLESQGTKQIRGNGILILTEKELYFELYLPTNKIIIPLIQITKIDTTRSHLGKSKFKQLLKIYFKNETGQNDSIAWCVQDLPKWKQTLSNLIKKEENEENIHDIL